MPLRHYLLVLIMAIAAAAVTVGAAFFLLPGQEWAAPAVMAALAFLALVIHTIRRRK